MRNRREISLLLSPFFANALTWGIYFVNTGRSPVRPPFFARLSDAGLDAVVQYVVFELSEDCQHPCQGESAGRGQIEGFAQRDEADIPQKPRKYLCSPASSSNVPPP